MCVSSEPEGVRTVYRPPIVRLCGSHAAGAVAQAQLELVLAGKVVVTPFVVSIGEPDGGRTAVSTLEELRRASIDHADEVVVVNPGGIVDEATAGEIAYALSRGALLSFTEELIEVRLLKSSFDEMLSRTNAVEVRLQGAEGVGLFAYQVVRFVGGARSLLACIEVVQRPARVRVLPPLLGLGDELRALLDEGDPEIASEETSMVAISLQVLGEESLRA